MCGRAHAIVEVRNDLLHAVGGRREPGMDTRGRGEAPGGIRTREEADLDGRLVAELRELVELGVGLHEDPGPL